MDGSFAKGTLQEMRDLIAKGQSLASTLPPTQDGSSVAAILQQLNGCVELLQRYGHTSHQKPALGAERVPMLEMKLAEERAKRQQLERQVTGKQYSDVRVVPRVTDDSIPPADVAQLLSKLSVIRASEFSYVPSLKVPQLLELSQNAMYQVYVVLPFCKLGGPTGGAADVQRISTAGAAAHRDACMLAQYCSDATEKRQLKEAAGAWEKHVDAFVGALRAGVVDEKELDHYRRDVLHHGKVLVGGLAPTVLKGNACFLSSSSSHG